MPTPPPVLAVTLPARRALAAPFRALGWKLVGGLPDLPKYVVCAAPHTTNWDYVSLLLVSMMFGVKLNWMGKHTLFRPPLGWLMRATGGVPVDRRSHGDFVSRMAAEFERHERLILVVPAEGTRKRAEYWKSGFYFIAKQAKVPLVVCALDYGTKELRFSEPFLPGDSVKTDMDRIRAIVRDAVGWHPDRVGPVRLKNEEN